MSMYKIKAVTAVITLRKKYENARKNNKKYENHRDRFGVPFIVQLKITVLYPRRVML